MPSIKYLIALAGPTAVGKTDLSINIAKHFGAEILSCDSRQIYKELNIGVAKPDDQSLKQAVHHFINSTSIFNYYSAGKYESEALALLDELFQKSNIALVCGGTGLYMQALLEGLDEYPSISEDVREALIEEFRQKGISNLQNELEKKDPEYYSKVDINNSHRLIRALSVIRSSGRTFSSFQSKKPADRPFRPIQILLERDRPELYERINSRVDYMMEMGLLDEARSLFQHKDLKALQTVGYQELFRFLEGEMELEFAVSEIKKNSRRYAKRQMTWFRNRQGWVSFHPDDQEGIIRHIDMKMSLE